MNSDVLERMLLKVLIQNFKVKKENVFLSKKP